MSDHESPEAVKARDSQPDPVVMYLVVRESLPMGPGKIGAQCGHAVGMVMQAYDRWRDCREKGPDGHHSKSEYKRVSTTTDLSDDEVAVYRLWLQTSYRKVVLRADDKEWEKLKAAGLRHFVVRDSGLTEVAPGSETVIGVWPLLRSQSPKVLKRLQAL